MARPARTLIAIVFASLLVGNLTFGLRVDKPPANQDREDEQPKKRHKLSMLVTDKASASEEVSDQENGPKESQWFQSFSEGESTYDADADSTSLANPMHHYIDGWSPVLSNPYVPSSEVVRKEFFHESPSAGAKAAWQTHYPAIQHGLAAHGVHLGKWTENAGGSWTQEYNPQEGDRSSQDGALPADWFDTYVNQIDGFGRQSEPSPLSPRRYMTWEERAVNTTMSCQLPGCSSTVTLQAFDGVTEQARNCLFSLKVTPTDYDDQYSNEFIDYVTVNDVTVDMACKPRLSGCNATAQRTLFSCPQQVSLDKIINGAGTLKIEAKINHVVDECPYEGNLFHAIPQVTCLVTGKQPRPLFNGTANDPSFLAGGDTNAAHGNTVLQNVNANGQSIVSITGPLKCKDRGCTANQFLQIPELFQHNATCRMNLYVNQTDYDRDDDSPEQINFIQINGENVTTDVRPMRNPCKSQYQGNPIPDSERVYTALHDYPVNTSVGGLVMVSGQITEVVDECPSQGNLLDALVQINCTSSDTA